MKTKLALIIVGSILIGLVIGVIGTGSYTRHKVVQIKEMGTPEGMHKRFYNMIVPSEYQSDSIKLILHDFARQSDEMRKKHWLEHKELFNHMLNDLRPFLTEEQMERLENFRNKSPMERYRRSDDSPRHRHGRQGKEDSVQRNEKRERRRVRLHN